MNDKLIISSISKVYLAIVSFFIFIFLALSVTYLLLSNGVYLKELSLSSLHINKLYIKWDEKLNIHVDKLTIFTNNDDSDEDFQIEDIKKHIKSLGLLSTFIESFIIETLNYRDIKATLRYLDNSGGYVKATSKNFNIDTVIHKTNSYINLEILNFRDSIKKIDAHGNIVLDLNKRQVALSLDTEIGKDLSLNIYTYINSKQLKYAIYSKKKILSIEHLISILKPNKTVKYWAYDAIKMKEGTLRKACGFIDFSNSSKALKNFYLSIDVKGMEYKYNLALDSIYTQTTNLEFKNGILNIRPTNHTTYNMNLDKSWLKIDFSKEEFILTLYLMLDGFVDKNILYLLKTFNVKLPFKQNSGTLHTDLTLKINLHKIDVDARGTFSVKKANFTYLGLDLDIYNSHIKLENSNVVIDKMFAKYKNNISANLTANIDTKNSTGKISLDVRKANFNDNAFILDNSIPLKSDYIMSNNNDLIKISKSKWNIFSKEKASIEELEIPFNYENLFAKIPTTQVNIENLANIYFSGSSSFKTLSTNLELDLTKFKYGDIELAQSNLLFDVSFADSKLHLSSKEKMKFTLLNRDCSIYKPNISFHKNNIVANSSKLKIENILDSKIAFNYSTEYSNGFLNLKQVKLKNDSLGNMFENNNFVSFNLKNKDGIFTANSPSINTIITISKDKWNIALNSLNSIYEYSDLLKKYALKDGKISFFKQKNNRNISFLANINHKYSFLSINNKLINNYIINGELKNDSNDVHFNINNKLHIDIKDQVSITGSNVGINLGAVVKYIKEISDDNNTKDNKNIDMELENSNIYFSEHRRATSDRISVQYHNKIATAQLEHEGGHAGFKLQDNVFYLYGENFNGKFMENLFSLSKFKDGDFDFSVKGSLEEFIGIMYVKDTTIIEYKLLNNILAFINTIPSLVTFSLPGYSKSGLNVKSSYINFSFKDNKYILKDIYLDSKEMKIAGNGVASYENNTIDLNLNIKTDLGSTVSKIPIVGYIVLDKDSISTSVKVSGALDNPKVKSMLATDIIVAPLNIIKRTLLFPFEIFKSDK